MKLNTAFMKETFFLALRGIPVTLEITLITLLLAIPFGFLIALLASNPKHRIANKIIAVYVSYNRGTPVIVQMLIIYALLPDLMEWLVEIFSLSLDVNKLSNMFYVVLFFVLWQTAFLSKTFAAGLKSVGKGQYEAAVSNGLNGFHAYVRIIAPQVFKAILPVLCTNVNGLIKMTSLSYSMCVLEITGLAKVAAAGNLCYLEAYIVTACVYLILCLSVELLFKQIERYWERKKTDIGQTKVVIGGADNAIS